MGSLALAVLAVGICAALLTIVYGLTMPFWTYWEGRALFSLAAIFTVWFWFGVAINAHWLSLTHAQNVALSWLIVVVICASFITLMVSALCARIRNRRNRDRQ